MNVSGFIGFKAAKAEICESSPDEAANVDAADDDGDGHEVTMMMMMLMMMMMMMMRMMMIMNMIMMMLILRRLENPSSESWPGVESSILNK